MEHIKNPRPIKPRMCWKCENEDCSHCENDFNRCPNCDEILDRDCGEKFKHCPECGQALLWEMVQDE